MRPQRFRNANLKANKEKGKVPFQDGGNFRLCSFEANSDTKRAVLGGKEKASSLPDRLQHSLVGVGCIKLAWVIHL